MRPELKYWRDLPKDEKSRLMLDRNIKTITYSQIQEIYNETHNKQTGLITDLNKMNMKRKYKYLGTDGNGGFYESITKNEYASMIEAITNEIIYNVHSIMRVEVVNSK